VKAGDVVICRGKICGIITQLDGEKRIEWVRILWSDNRFTWEEVEPSFVPGIIEVISETR